MFFNSRIHLYLVLGVSMLLLLLGLAEAAAADLGVQETPLNPEGIAYEVNPGPQGRLWVSDNSAEEIWAIDPLSGDYTTYNGAGWVSDARQAPDGGVWWVDQIDESLGRLSPESGAAAMWKIPGAATLLGTAIDARGDIWLSQYFDPQFYRFTVKSSQVCTYTLASGGGSDYILAQGTEIWLGDWINDRIHRLDPESGQLTSWTLPYMFGFSYYPEGLAMDSAGNLWWADIDLHRLARLEPELDRLTTYALPYGSDPHMVAVSGRRIWYTEGNQGSLGRLDPHLASGSAVTISHATTTLTPTCAILNPNWSGTLTSTTGTVAWASAVYTNTVDAGGWRIHQLPPDAYPWGIAASSGQVWLVDNGRQVLAHAQDSLSLAACSVSDADGNPDTTDDRTPLAGWMIHLIEDGQPVEPGQLTKPTGCAVWDDLEPGKSYGVREDVPPGWTLLGAASHEFGVLDPGEAYVHTFANAESATVQACSRADADGDPNTTGDQTPLPGETIYLHVDGVRQEPGLVTANDGCQSWSDLAPNHTYAVEQEETITYTLLGEALHDFGSLAPGMTATHTFINAESVTVTACSLADADGDQTPLPGQTIYLRVDGVQQKPGLVTAANGCQSWSDLAPNHTYGVEQVLAPGWEALTSDSYNFGVARPGDVFQGTFINREGSRRVYLPMLRR